MIVVDEMELKKNVNVLLEYVNIIQHCNNTIKQYL